MPLHKSTFQYILPSDAQRASMEKLRTGFEALAATVIAEVPEGRDRDRVIDQLRDGLMWANQGVLREPDGTPRPGAVV